MPNGFSLFTTTFKNIGTTSTFDLKTIKPTDPNGKVLNLSDGTVFVCLLDSNGNYGSLIYWKGKSLGGWSKSGENTVIADGEVLIGDGVGIAVYNNIRVNANGDEYTGKSGATTSPLKFLVSGQVDLVCKNLVAQGFSINGNSTPSSIDLTKVKPTDMNGKVLNLSDGTVFVCLLDSEGNYGTLIYWKGKTLGGWSKSGESALLSEGEVVLSPGRGFAVYNNVRANANGDEYTGKSGAVATTIYLTLPSPVSE